MDKDAKRKHGKYDFQGLLQFDFMFNHALSHFSISPLVQVDDVADI